MAEYTALQDLYYSTDGPKWLLPPGLNKSHWIFPSNLSAPCTDNWQGFVCRPSYVDNFNSSTCYIAVLSLQRRNLNGLIPESISDLSHLEELLLQYNFLQGTIPNQLGTMLGTTKLPNQ